MRKIAIIFLITSIGLKGMCQDNLVNTVTEYFESVRNNVYSTTPDKQIYSPENAEELLKIVANYYSDSTSAVRLKACYLTYKSTYKSNNQKLRNRAVFNLIQALKDEDSGNVGSTIQWLTNYTVADFTDISKDSLKSILNSQSSYKDQIIKLIGFVGLYDQINFLKENLSNGTYKTNKTIWATHLALARLGDESEIELCLALVKKQGVNDDVIYELVPNLIYTRQKLAFDYIVQLLHSNEKNCYSANPENLQKITCAYRLMEYLAPVIKNFPLEVDSMGDLVVNDYEKALTESREWFKINQSDYEIITNTY
ncbi:MAG: hypothetical protein KOO66_03470 [Bacteroidales bacterium]|nr:hypothetical protein [Bacteroidales bacterium]